MQRCPSGSLRTVQLPLDHLVEMRDRAVCHQHSNGRRNYVLVWYEPQRPVDLLWIPPLPRPPWKTYQWDSNQRSGIPVMSSDERLDRRIWWLTVSKAADISNRMRTDDLESAFAIRRASVTESSAVSVEWPLLKPDWLASSLLFCERNNETWLKTTRSSVFTMNGRREMGLYFSIREVFKWRFFEQWGYPSLLECRGESAF